MNKKTIIITILGIIALVLIAGCSKNTPNIIKGAQQTKETPTTTNTQRTTDTTQPDTDTQFVDENDSVDIGESI